MLKEFYFKQFSLACLRSFNIKNSPISSISIQFSSISPIDRTLSGATTLSQSGPGEMAMVLCITPSPSISETSPSDCLVPYPGHSLSGGKGLLLCRETVGVFYSPSRLGKTRRKRIRQHWLYSVDESVRRLHWKEQRKTTASNGIDNVKQTDKK